MATEGQRQIVDEHDEIISFKVSREVNHPQDIYRVSALWVTNSQGKVLLAQRGLRLRNGGGLWGPAVAGTVDEGETYESNIYKEAQEEIGLEGHTFTAAQKIFSDGARRFFCQWFTVVIDDYDFTPDPREVAAIEWFDPLALQSDVVAQPGRYIPHFSDTLELFIK